MKSVFYEPITLQIFYGWVKCGWIILLAPNKVLILFYWGTLSVIINNFEHMLKTILFFFVNAPHSDQVLH